LIVVPLKTDLFKAKIEASTLNPLVAAEFEYNKKVVDGDSNNITVKPEEIVSPPVNEPVKTEIVAPVASEAEVFCLITGSFKSEENAAAQVSLLKEEGFSPEIVTTGNGFYRVSAIVCSDMKTALIKKDSLSKKFPGAWVSRKR
jgi:cell division protein FtsN